MIHEKTRIINLKLLILQLTLELINPENLFLLWATEATNLQLINLIITLIIFNLFSTKLLIC